METGREDRVGGSVDRDLIPLRVVDGTTVESWDRHGRSLRSRTDIYFATRRTTEVGGGTRTDR